MTKIDFNRGWRFAESECEWPDDFGAASLTMGPVILPHTWNADDMVLGDSLPYVGPGWYRKRFRAPELRAGQRLLLETEGATNIHKVWVNGGYAGGRYGGFLPSLMDVTDLLQEGENTILIRVDNAYDLRAAMPRHVDWNRYGGITRPVWLHVREHAYLTGAGVEVETFDVSEETARTRVRTHVQEQSRPGGCLEVRHTLESPEGDVLSLTSTELPTSYSRVSTAEIELPEVARPRLWSDVTPTLYVLRTEVIEDGQVIDSRTDRIGFRYYTFDAEKGLLLNGKPTKLKGANIHIFFPGLGNALPDRFHRSDMALMKEMGCNFMRTSHYPRPKACLDACDELGILVVEEQPYWHGSIRAADGEAAVDNVERLVQDMVRHHRNHPSIILWNTVNEVMLAPAYKPGVGHLEPNDPRREAWKINPKEYPYIRRHLQKLVDTFKAEDPSRPVSMVVGGAWQVNDDAGLTSLSDIVMYNGGAMNFSDDFVGPLTGKRYAFRPDYYREVFPERIHMMSEGILNAFCYERGDWEQEEMGWQESARYWDAVNARAWFCGGAMWCFTDYSANGLIRLHGVVDRYRLPKELFWFYRAMWSDEPVLHILGHWNYSVGETRGVVVFTNCDTVELTLNGRSLGAGRPASDAYPHIENPPLIWECVPFDTGELKAVGGRGRKRVVDSRVTASPPAQIILAASNDELRADGRDISFVDAMVCDADGNRCYTECPRLTATVTGAGLLAGGAELQAPGGLARFPIRSNGRKGKVVVSVASAGIPKTGIELVAT